MILVINLLTFIILSIFFAFLLAFFLRKIFFDISVLYKFIFFIVPLVFFIVNFSYLIAIRSSYILLSASPMIIPILYRVYIYFQDSSGHKIYKKYKGFSKELLDLARSNNVKINYDDIIVRVKKRNSVSIIINVYSEYDERKIKCLYDEIQKLIINYSKENKVELLVDKKKGDYKIPLIGF